jgi:hypothetical protein
MKFGENFGTSAFRLGDLSAPVNFIHLCAYANADNAGDGHGQTATNHWAMFLQLDGDLPGASVGVDMIPGAGEGEPGMIVLESFSYARPPEPETIKVLSTLVVEEVLVQTILETIIGKGRQRYIFKLDEGCRYWMSVVARDFEDSGIVERGWAERAGEALRMYWRYPDGSETRPMTQGTFY